MHQSPFIVALAFILLTASAAAAQLSPDDVAGVHRLLRERKPESANDPLTNARRLIREHRYHEAQQLVDAHLTQTRNHAQWQELKTRLLIQAWRLDDAMAVARGLPNKDMWIGRIQLLKKQYDAALASAKAAQAAQPGDAEAYLLEADVHFWKEKPELAHAPLKRALELDPLNADARFAYGYGIWRRVDARQLPAMAAQWNLALAIDPLHYVTHWHFGNGHTHLTYADYVQPTDSVVRIKLRGVDSLVADGRLVEALRRTRELEAEYPQSLLPELARGSVFYMTLYVAHDIPAPARLDSAERAFLRLLKRKPNYGPAHNGLAAVIKQRQFAYVAQFDSLEKAIAREPVPNSQGGGPFYQVFKNIVYFPGERAEKMAVQQLGPALAYIPFIARLGYTYVIPPLHHDLTEAMSNPFFRTGTTFDNRQWMDIRGSGGNHASAGIEYVERGSHQERVVLLHEYVHQFHGAVLTDQQVRRIRQLYYDAMTNNRTLDYYAANNESEFFAQSYEAYLSPVKVHPLNHKAMNTRADLVAKDPELFAFLDTLITENRAYLAGDRNAMRKNWAQVYVTLARQARIAAQRGSDSSRWRRPHALLDTAALHSPDYIPALLERAAVFQGQQRWADAQTILNDAAVRAPQSAAVLTARATLLRDRALSERNHGYLHERIALYEQAFEIETDLNERAELNRQLRELHYEHLLTREAVQIAEQYVRQAPTASTYLRDRKDEAAAFAAELRAALGETRQASAFFDELLQRKPQHYGHRLQAARVRLLANDAVGALTLLDEGRRLMAAAGQHRVDYETARADALAKLGRTDSARAVLDRLAAAPGRLSTDDRIRASNTLIAIGMKDVAKSLLPSDTALLSPRQQAELRSLKTRLSSEHVLPQSMEPGGKIPVPDRVNGSSFGSTIDAGRYVTSISEIGSNIIQPGNGSILHEVVSGTQRQAKHPSLHSSNEIAC